MYIGLISDTHGLMRPEALEALNGVEHIIHAGDVGKIEVMTALREIAPVTAVRGNVDVGPVVASLPSAETVTFGAAIHVVHDLMELGIDPAQAGIKAVISGHTHQPEIETRGGVLYINPGSAGPRRFKLPVTLGFLIVSSAGALDAHIQQLAV